MIYLYGDSHSNFSFINLNLPHTNNYSTSITMFRIGRDNKIINFSCGNYLKNFSLLIDSLKYLVIY